MTTDNTSMGKSGGNRPRSLRVNEWSEAEQRAWEDACRPGLRLKPGGAASRLAQGSRDDYAASYGAFLGFLQRAGRLQWDAAAAAQVTLANVEAYLADLQGRVCSVTVCNCISRLRRTARLLAPTEDFSWLAEIEKDLKLVMEPRPKFDRLVDADRLAKAGLTLVVEALEFSKNDPARARGVRNGLMIALLAFLPIRLKNFAALEIGITFKLVEGSWWIVLPSVSTKSRRPHRARVPERLNCAIEAYLKESRPILIGSNPPTNALWVSSTTGGPMTKKNLGTLFSKITRETLGVDVSPHLFRTCAVSTAATYAGDTPHLGSALLNYTGPRVTELYDRASSVQATRTYGEIILSFLRD
jgi:site-specific recombinase XerD